MCFGCSKEPSHRDDSVEYPQNMFWLRNKKNYFQLHTFILGLNINQMVGSISNDLFNGFANESHKKSTTTWNRLNVDDYCLPQIKHGSSENDWLNVYT